MEGMSYSCTLVSSVRGLEVKNTRRPSEPNKARYIYTSQIYFLLPSIPYAPPLPPNIQLQVTPTHSTIRCTAALTYRTFTGPPDKEYKCPLPGS